LGKSKSPSNRSQASETIIPISSQEFPVQRSIAISLILSFLFVGCAASAPPAPLFSDDADTARLRAAAGAAAARAEADAAKYKAEEVEHQKVLQALNEDVARGGGTERTADFDANVDKLVAAAHARQASRRQTALALLAKIAENTVRGGFKCVQVEDDTFVALDCDAKGKRAPHFVAVRIATGISEVRTVSWSEYHARQSDVDASLTRANAEYKQQLA
jgi:hypothetical protein